MYEVKVNIYDLSNGWAQKMSPMLIGKQIGGIWHTGIVVYGKEYFYGGGIQYDDPDKVQELVGKPIETKTIGYTQIPKELFHEYLGGLNPKYEYKNYNLFTQNCNHFSNEIAEFLTSIGIPEYIVDLPKVCQGTAIGSMIKSLMENIDMIGKKIEKMND